MKLINGECLEEMTKMESESVDMILTSPPYDNLRTYNGTNDWSFEVFKPIAQELSRLLKDGGVIVWVVGDSTIKGSETGTSFRQALYFKDECGLNIHDTMIYEKPNCYAFDSRQKRYKNIFEYMFILSKGKPKVGNLIKDKPVKSFGKTFSSTKGRTREGVLRKNNPVKSEEYQVRYNIWKISNDSRGIKHPAVFPERLAEDHILSWSNEGDTVFDPFMGSGTTGKMALLNNRDFIGIERVENYFNIAKERIGIKTNFKNEG